MDIVVHQRLFISAIGEVGFLFADQPRWAAMGDDVLACVFQK